jgi:hypothetical protein
MGRLHSVTSGSFRKVRIQGPLLGDELGKRSGMSRPKPGTRSSSPTALDRSFVSTSAATTASTQHESSAGLSFRSAGAQCAAAAGATCAIAYSASAVIVNDGLTPGLAGIAAPSQTIRLR